ncbi:ACP S-malonyltransferase [Kordiimonas gwangyangensis]|uniref:ACP S-malonyltransferase n=1 Tax=Kordiimonas gwangyangensis TaxID=288022 RepID=UPI000362F0F7|nr:ACP S-malonyltransferase [Kordiimonas gwangyangensis]
MTVWMFPGQGAQAKGMGDDLFDRFPVETAQADEVLGYSIADLCRHDRDGLLRRTDYTQPALYTVCALSVLARHADGEPEPDFVAGHSLGEYAALFAAGVFDFATGLRLVKKRGQLMAEASEGGMLAIIGQDEAALKPFLERHGFGGIDIANLNSPKQTVLSGVKSQIMDCAKVCETEEITAIPLNVSAAFHSQLMEDAAKAFADFLKDTNFAQPRIPVIANVTARPYGNGDTQAIVRELLSRQIAGTVRWRDTVDYLHSIGERDFIEVGPGVVLTRMLKDFPAPAAPTPKAAVSAPAPAPEMRPSAKVVSIEPKKATRPADTAATESPIGAPSFMERYGLEHAYVTGSMYRGIASSDMVIAMANAGCMGFLGTGGMPARDVQDNIGKIKAALGAKRNWGANLLSHPDAPQAELALAKLYVAEDVPVVEASAFVTLSRALVYYRYAGAKRASDGSFQGVRRVILKASRPEVARQFLAPAPAAMLDSLIADGLLDQEAAYVAEHMPVIDDLTAESDSGGHTDQASPFTLIPTFLRVRAEAAKTFPDHHIHVGAAGGIGSPEAIVAAVALGADYIVTGSINQCTTESGMSPTAKDMLQALDIGDFAYAPAGDMFEIGAKAQVVRKGSFFAARAERLYQLYRHYDSLDDLPPDVRTQVEDRFFMRSFDDVWQGVVEWLSRTDPDLLERAKARPKVKMALVFRWYFKYSADLALDGDASGKVNYQLHSGPALAAFNSWARENNLTDWRTRHCADIAMRLMGEARARLSGSKHSDNKLGQGAPS